MSAAVAIFSLDVNMVFNAPSIKAATLAETAAAGAAFPAAMHAAASTVEPTNPGASAAGATQSESRTADSAAGEPATQRRLGFLQPPAQRPLARTELPGCFVLGLAFQVAKDQRQPPFVRQLFQFGVKDGTEFSPG